jgi:hypothetical protein
LIEYGSEIGGGFPSRKRSDSVFALSFHQLPRLMGTRYDERFPDMTKKRL